MQQVEHENSVRDKVQSDYVTTTLNKAYTSVLQSKDISGISPSDRTVIAQHMPALIDFANHLAKGEPTVTDPKVWYALMQKSAGDPAEFVKEDLTGYVNKLSKEDFKQLGDIQAAIVKGDRVAAEKFGLAGFRTNQEVINNSLTQYGFPINPTDQSADQKNQVAELHRAVDQQVAIQEQTIGKKASPQDVQRIVDGILSTPGSRTTGGFFRSIPLIGSMFSPYQTGSVIETTIGDVPASDRAMIEKSLRSQNLPVSDVTILNTYIQKLYRERNVAPRK